MSRHAVALALAVATSISAAERTSTADEAARACAASFEQSQYLQKDHKLREARAAALACAASTCPAFVRDACQKLLADIDAAQPTVVLAAQDAAGADLARVRVELDGQPFAAQLGAEALPVDPGEHTLRFIYGDNPPIEQHVIVRVAEKNRLVRATFSSPTPGGLTPPPVSGNAPSKAGPIWPSLLVGGVGLGAVAASVGVGVGAKSSADSLRNTCAPRCAASDVADVNTRLVVSDVLLGAGIAVVGVATVLFILSRGGHESPAQPVVAATGGGLAVEF